MDEPTEKRQKSIPEDLFKVHDEELEGDGGFACLREACLNKAKPIRTLALSELPLDSIPFHGISMFNLFLDSVFLFVFGWPAQFGSA